MTCYQELINAYKKHGNKNALYYFGCKLGMKDFIRNINSLANSFRKLGVGKNDVVTIFLPNTIQAFASFYAINKIGAVANIVHPLTPVAKLKEYIISTNTKCLIVLDILINNTVDELNAINTTIIVARNSDYINDIKKPFFKIYETLKTNNIKRLNNMHYFSNLVKNNKNSLNVVSLSDNNLAAYVHSGGTSGESKTIKLSNKAICSLSKLLLSIHKCEGKEFTPAVLPLFHAYGLVAGMHAPIVVGSSVIIFPKFSAEKVNKSLKKYNVTTIMSVPLMIAKMMNEKNFYGPHLQKLKTVYCGGDTVNTILTLKFNNAVKKHGGTAKLLAGYGLTEASSVVTVNTMEEYKLGSVGKPLKDVIIEIWDDNNVKQAPGVIGEIAIGGPTLMNGYYNSEEDGITRYKNKKYIKTGDLGYFDDEGYLFISGRKKRLIKIASYNIFPSEIENTVLEIPYVSEACVIEGVKNNKKIVKLIISLKNCPYDFEQAKKEIFTHCTKNLIKYSLPKEIEIVEAMPRTSFGKVDYIRVAVNCN